MSRAQLPWTQVVARPAAGETHLWLCDLEQPFAPGQLERFAALLDADERARWQRFRFERDRHSFLVSHALLRSVLARYAGRAAHALRFERGELGKPRLSEPGDPAFNLSHSHARALLAVGPPGIEIGVDIEQARSGRRFAALAQRHFAAPEIASLVMASEAESARVFYRFWTLKEAYVKARATGLSLALDGFWFGWGADAMLRLDAFPEIDPRPECWHASGWELDDGYAAALVRGRDAASAVPPRWFGVRPLQSWWEVDVAAFASSPA